MNVKVERSISHWLGRFGKLAYTSGLTRVGNEIAQRYGQTRSNTQNPFRIRVTESGLLLDDGPALVSPHKILARRLWQVGVDSIVVDSETKAPDFKHVFRQLLYRTQRELENSKVINFSWMDSHKQKEVESAIARYQSEMSTGQSVFARPWVTPDRLAFLGDSLFANTRAFTIFPEQKDSLAGFLTRCLLSEEIKPDFPSYGRPYPIDVPSIMRDGVGYNVLLAYSKPKPSPMHVPESTSRSTVFAAPAATYKDIFCEPEEIEKDRTTSTYVHYMPESLVTQLIKWLAMKKMGQQSAVFIWVVNDFMTLNGQGFVAGRTPLQSKLEDFVQTLLREIYAEDSTARPIFFLIPDIPTLTLKPIYQEGDWSNYQKGEKMKYFRDGRPIPWGSFAMPFILDLVRQQGQHKPDDVILPQEVLRTYRAIEKFNLFLRRLTEANSRVSVIDVNALLREAARGELGGKLFTEDGVHPTPILQALAVNVIITSLNEQLGLQYPTITPERLALIRNDYSKEAPPLNEIQQVRRALVNRLIVYACRAGGSFIRRLPWQHTKKIFPAVISFLWWTSVSRRFQAMSKKLENILFKH
ncbi:hypothetical protein HZB07_00965 [Candidatus Saganbacteria bacterium]|nr:hypothetical protein [Candidatus Saganbacteria bacterium]